MNKLITLKGQRNGALILEIEGTEHALPLADLETFLRNQGTFSFQQADKITNVESIEGIQKLVMNILPTSLPRVPKLLTNLPRAVDFIGRQAELDKIRAHLQAGKQNIVVKGLGGVGKTTLAQRYAEQYAAHYDYIVWLRQGDTLQTAFAGADTLHQNLKLAFTVAQSEAMRFDLVINALANLNGQGLLVLDNYAAVPSDKERQVLQKFPFGKWHILFTSREEIPRFQSVPLGVLPTEEAEALFKRHARKKNVDEQELASLLHAIGYHTLTVELLAKTYAESWEINSIGEMAETLRKQAIDADILQECVNLDSTGESVKTYEYLLKVFRLSDLTEDEEYILIQFAVLPVLRIAGKDFCKWLENTGKKLKEPLQNLARKGWLASEGAQYFEIHPLLQMVVLRTLKPTLEICFSLFKYFMNFIVNEEVRANPLAYQWLIEVGEALLQRIDYEGEKKNESIVWNSLHFLYDNLGDYLNVLRCAEKDVNIAIEIGSEHPVGYLNALNNLAIAHIKVKNYSKALLLYQEVLPKQKIMLGEYDPSYLNTLSNLGNLYREIGNYGNALSILQEVVEKQKKVLGEDAPAYLTSLNNLGGLYVHITDYDTALPLLWEALQKRKKVLGERHPDYAISLSSVASLYIMQDNDSEARPYLQQAYEIRKETLGEAHEHTKSIKKVLDFLSERESGGA